MSTDRQIEANRSNARKSTGPRSAPGKKRAAANAVTHGLLGRQIVLPGERAATYDAFRAGVLKALEPVGDLEALLADKLVADAWRLRRVPVFEAAVHRRSRHDREVEEAQTLVDEARAVDTQAAFAAIARVQRSDHRIEADQILREVKANKANLYMRDAVLDASRVLEDSVIVFANLWRHERALVHGLHRTLHELQRLQAARRGEAVPAPAALDLLVHADSAASATADLDDRLA